MKLMSVFVLGFLLAGCFAQQVAQVTTFNKADVATQLENGPNTIRGSALFNQVGGGTVTCAGRNVYLIPKSNFADERMQILYGNLQGGRAATGSSPTADENQVAAYLAASKNTICDAQGFFKFENIADGQFYVQSTITWGEYNSQGGHLMRPVTVNGGTTVELVLAP